jgi:hypothetical protein
LPPAAGDEAADVLPEAWEPLPFCALAPEELPPFALPAGGEGGCGWGCDPPVAPAVELELLPVVTLWLLVPSEPVEGADACGCGAGGGLAGAAGTLLVGSVTPALSRAAKGWLAFWLDAAADSAEEADTAGEALGAILGTLGTFGTPGSDISSNGLLATGGPVRLLIKIYCNQYLSVMRGEILTASFTQHPARFAVFPLSSRGFGARRRAVKSSANHSEAPERPL